VVIVDRERRVIGEAPALVDRLSDRSSGDARRGDLVIEAPADILGPGPAAVGPPGVLVGLVVQTPEDVDEADLIEDAREPGARLDVAPFGVELAAGEAAPHLVGGLPAVERHAAVALLLGEGVAAFVELEPVQLRIEVGLVAFQLLEADDVRLLRGEPAEQSLL